MAYTQDTPPGNHGAPGAAGAKISPELAEAISIGYEPHDVALRGIFIFLISLAVVSLLVLGAVWFILTAFVDFDRTFDPIASPVVVEKAPPPQPLQPSWSHNQLDQQDMLEMRDQTYKQLHFDGVSPTGRKCMPIETAMDEILPLLPIHAAPHSGGGGGDQ